MAPFGPLPRTRDRSRSIRGVPFVGAIRLQGASARKRSASLLAPAPIRLREPKAS
jgi:hypothetical protein